MRRKTKNLMKSLKNRQHAQLGYIPQAKGSKQRTGLARGLKSLRHLMGAKKATKHLKNIY